MHLREFCDIHSDFIPLHVSPSAVQWLRAPEIEIFNLIR